MPGLLSKSIWHFNTKEAIAWCMAYILYLLTGSGPGFPSTTCLVLVDSNL
jgi:hypothetical protein